ncbi:MAG TPA: hypothetical protein VFA26_22030 [Gemmataceae bacterium]|nr:hypothetical protein [Gemmataceae bacterium]
MTKRVVAGVLLLGLSLTPLACRPRKAREQPPPPANRVEYFKQKQAETYLPNGRQKVVLDTVEETPDGRIRYQTTDGQTWVVEMKPTGDGRYKFGWPEPAK